MTMKNLSSPATRTLNAYIAALMSGDFARSASPVQTTPAAPCVPDPKASWLTIDGKRRPHP
jgi:hypothetical protein